MAHAQNRVIRVLVVDDSAFMRKVISDILNSDPAISVAGTARNGEEALKAARELNPDVITLDVEMPVVDGLTCLKALMKENFYKVIMLSSLTTEGADATFQALDEGAVDFVAKPVSIFDIKGEDIKFEIIDKVKIAYSARREQKYKNIPKKPERKTTVGIKQAKPANTGFHGLKNIVAIGISTGGPKALQTIMPLFPEDLPAAVIVVQHMPAGFTKSLADRLDSISRISVKEAQNNETIEQGKVYIAPGGFHTTFVMQSGNLTVKLLDTPPVGGLRPTADIMMESLSNTELTNIIGVIMTGMGGDGSEGIKLLKTKNRAKIIAQDEKTCVVYGMPKMAVITGMVDIIAPLGNIPAEILKLIGG